jgi:preprotein translocase subunit SecA
VFNIFSKLLDINQREIDRLTKIVAKINDFEPKIKKLKDADFPKKTEEFKKRITNNEELITILPEAFALVREAAWRTIGQRPFDVQLMASIALFVALLTLLGRVPGIAYWLAVVGSGYFAFHTAILDAIVWAALFRH